MRLIVIAVLVVASAACGDGDEPSPPSNDGTSDVGEVTIESGLTARLELSATSVAAGVPLPGTLHIDNDTDLAIVDPQCDLLRSRHALIRPGDTEPSGGLWNAADHDCGGVTYEPGETGSLPLMFGTNAADGEPLGPGTYETVVDVPGTTQDLVASVEVTATG